MTSINDKLEINPELAEALKLLFESSKQAESDFCGEQRDWHLPRLQRSAGLLLALFPHHGAVALSDLRTPYDDLEN